MRDRMYIAVVVAALLIAFATNISVNRMLHTKTHAAAAAAASDRAVTQSAAELAEASLIRVQQIERRMQQEGYIVVREIEPKKVAE